MIMTLDQLRAREEEFDYQIESYCEIAKDCESLEEYDIALEFNYIAYENGFEAHKRISKTVSQLRKVEGDNIIIGHMLHTLGRIEMKLEGLMENDLILTWDKPWGETEKA